MLNDNGKKDRNIKTVTFTSGIGGVGKTNITVNLAIAMKRLGRNVLIIDADFGMSNAGALLGLQPRYTIEHVLKDGMGLCEAVLEGPLGIRILPAGPDANAITSLDEPDRLMMIEAFDAYCESIDVLFVDAPPGISRNVAFFCAAAQEIVVVSSSDPASIATSANLMRTLISEYRESDFNLLVSAAHGEQTARDVFRQVSQATEDLQNIALHFLGHIPSDSRVHRSIIAQQAYLDLFPETPVSRRTIEIARSLLKRKERLKGTLQFFLKNILSAQRDSGIPGPSEPAVSGSDL